MHGFLLLTDKTWKLNNNASNKELPQSLKMHHHFIIACAVKKS